MRLSATAWRGGRYRGLPLMTCARCASALSVLLIALFAWPCAAQPLGRLVVIPIATPDLALSSRIAARLEPAFAAQRVTPLSLHEARDRFLVRSRAPQSPTESDVGALARAAQDAVEHVAFGRVAAAQASVREVIMRAEQTLESLNRETATARSILDACLSLVRSTLATHNREGALEQAMRCRRLVPDLVPSEKAHPANVIGVLAEADDLLRRMRIGRLSVKSAPESGCAVYVNGRHLGTTPFELDRAAAGDYRVQVECAPRPGRVHLVQLGDEPVELVVDTALDRAVTSEPRLALRYESEQAAREQAITHAAAIGRELDVDDVVLVHATAADATLLRVRVKQRRLVGSVALPLQEQRVQSAALQEAVEALAEARLLAPWSADGEGRAEHPRAPALTNRPAPPGRRAAEAARAEQTEPRRADDEEPRAQAEAQAITPAERGAVVAHDVSAERAPSHGATPRLRRRRIGGAVGLVLGVATLGLSYGLSVRRHERAETLRAGLRDDDDTYPRYARAWDDARVLSYSFAAVGTLIASGSVAALALSRPQPLPVWSAVAAAVAGAGLIGWGAYDVARGDSCGLGEFDRRLCVDAREQRDRGALVLLSALPLLTLPLVRLLGPATSETEIALAPTVQRGSVASTLRVTFVDLDQLLRL